MMIIETCPECGHDLVDLVLTTNPPITQKKCFNCGWEWTGEREEVVRVPFGGNSYTTTTTTDASTLTINARDYIDYTDFTVADVNNSSYNLAINNEINNFAQPACENCSNNPKNGGSGICHCTLGQMQVTC